MPRADTLSDRTAGAERIGGHGLKLNLGAGKALRFDGWLNCDLYPGPTIDLTFDLQGEWPFADHSVSEIYLCHVLEHLHDPKAFFREAHRVLQPNGGLLIRVPYGGHHAAWWDLEHIRPWFPENFAMFQPGYADAVGNPQHDAWQWPFGVHIIQIRLSYLLTRLIRWWPIRWIFCHYPNFFDPEKEEIWAHLYALKTPEAIAQYRETHQSIVVGTTYAAWKYHVEDTAPTAPDADELVDLLSGESINGYLARIRAWERGRGEA